MKLEAITRVIQLFANRVVYEAKVNAKKNAVTGNLANSIKAKTAISESQSLISFFFDAYGKYQDAGVEGVKAVEVRARNYTEENLDIPQKAAKGD